MNGQPIIFHNVSNTGTQIAALKSIYYNIGSDNANGNVEMGDDFSYSVALAESPFTLEALDAKYPYIIK